MTAGVVLGAAGPQLGVLASAFPGASVAPLPGSLGLVTLPAVRLPPGWNQPVTTVRFVLPTGYPIARPDCFFADATLRLGNGAMPMNAGVQPIPGTAEHLLWFSWHVAAWDSARDSLLTYARVIQKRLAEPR